MSHPEFPFFPAVVSLSTVVPPNVAKAGRSAQTGVLPCLAEEEGGGAAMERFEPSALAGAVSCELMAIPATDIE